MISTGLAAPLGATPDSDGTHFALYSSGAECVELCLFDASGRETGRHELPDRTDDVWHGFLPGCRPGQHYGYRVHGPYAPGAGQRYNRHKLLIDPYARRLHGELTWSPAVFDFVPDAASDDLMFNELDSAPFVPKSVVCEELQLTDHRRPLRPWADTVIYETNVRGYTMRHPAIGPAERGRFRGMRNGQILSYLKALGITAIELMPVQAFVDEQFLRQRGLRNFWGYNTINFFAPANRYGGNDVDLDPVAEFREMVAAIHDAGIEVILDVVYNHTGESDEVGPTLSFRGIDNLCYYRTMPGRPDEYINDTGCGNTLNIDNPVVLELVLDSLSYWSRHMGVDGFRFDLATVLGRHHEGFSPQHPLLTAITDDPALQGLKMIAEPWDPGPGGYHLGRFGPGWGEWNDRYRDTVRRFWRGDAGQAGELAQRLHGSADLFDSAGRAPTSSINFVSSHDGFTLADTVAYEERHNERNGEANQDGHRHNFSRNYGTEGATKNAAINVTRRRQRLNMLATLLLSQGTPMLLAGDEFGNSQSGNNNAYPQDNQTGWLDWSGIERDPQFTASVRKLIQLRQATPLLRPDAYRHGHATNADGWRDIEWRRPDGGELSDSDWHTTQAFSMLLTQPQPDDERRADAGAERHADRAIAVLINAAEYAVEFRLPVSAASPDWEILFTSDQLPPMNQGVHSLAVSAHSIVCLRLRSLPV